MRRAVLALPQAGARFRTPLFAGERNAVPGARRIDRHGSELDGLEPDPQARRPPAGRLHRLQPRRAACAVRRVRRVLCHGAGLKGGDEDTGRCLAVRDLQEILMLVVPPDFRLALVPGTPASGAIYRKTEAEFRAVGLNARFFESEALAEQWFGS